MQSLPLNLLHSTHIALQYVRHRNRSVGLLIGFHNRNQGAAHGHARAIERVDMTDEPFMPKLAALFQK